MRASSQASAATPNASGGRRGIRGFLRGPRLVDRQGFLFLLVVFVLIVVVFGVAFYEFVTHLQPVPSVPIQFSGATMVRGNATFNVTAVGNDSFLWTGFSVNLSVNNFGGTAVRLAASGMNATIVIGSNVYHVLWFDVDHDGRVNVGDVFWVTGNNARLPPLSYCKFSLRWDPGPWTAAEYWTTSSSIV